MSIPLLPFLFVFLLGRLLSYACPPLSFPWELFLLLSLAAAAWAARGYRVAFFGLLSANLVMGWAAFPSKPSAEDVSFAGLDAQVPAVFEGDILSVLPRQEGRGEVAVALKARCDKDRCLPLSGPVVLSWEGPLPPPGTPIRFRSRLNRLESDGNPRGSSRPLTLRREGFVRRGFVTAEAWRPLFRAAPPSAPLSAPPSAPLSAPPSAEPHASSYHRAKVAVLGARHEVRTHLRAFYLKAAPERLQGLVLGLTLGDRSMLTDDVQLAFANAGLAHILAISGGHMALIALGIEAICRFVLLLCPLSREWRVHRLAPLMALVPVVLYGFLIGLSPAISRSVLMSAVALLLKMNARRVPALALLVLVACLIAGVEENALLDVGCQLSFVSVVALLLFSERLSRLAERILLWPFAPGMRLEATLRRGLRLCLPPLMTSVAATLGTAPLVAYHFGQLSLIGLVANIPAVPLLGVFSLPLLLIGGLLHLLGLPGAATFVSVGSVSVGWGLSVAQFFGDALNFAPFVCPITGWEALMWGALPISTLLARRARAPVMLGLLSLVLATLGQKAVVRQPLLRMTQLNVGQGDCIILHLPDGRVAVIDAGGAVSGPPRRGEGPQKQSRGFDPGRGIVLPYLRREGYQRVDLMVMTHPHPDHVGGLVAIAEEMPVAHAWIGTLPDGRGGPFADLMKALSHQGTRISLLTSSMTLPSVGGVSFRCLHPRDGWESLMHKKASRNGNNGSIALEVSYGEVEILLAGDVEQEVEALLADTGALHAVEVLKVPHHGSDTSSSPALVSATSPQIVTLGVGSDNQYGFPRPSVLNRFWARGATTWRTDLDGAITVTTDGHLLECYGERSRRRMHFEAEKR